MLAEVLACPHCSEEKLLGVIAREPDAVPTVFLGCAACKGLVASFRLDQGFLNKRAMESVVSALGTNIFESGREVAEAIEKLSADAVERYNAALLELDRIKDEEKQQRDSDRKDGSKPEPEETDEDDAKERED